MVGKRRVATEEVSMPLVVTQQRREIDSHCIHTRADLELVGKDTAGHHGFTVDQGEGQLCLQDHNRRLDEVLSKAQGRHDEQPGDAAQHCRGSKASVQARSLLIKHRQIQLDCHNAPPPPLSLFDCSHC